ncbi:MAG TPA: diacylglycerol kinase family protein [Acidimicrobiales bacterium]|nr:diacylglycerol kinase family protein [Acidimicrobiales bacterium]
MRRALFVVNQSATGHARHLHGYCEQAAARHGWQAEFLLAVPGQHSQLLDRQLSDYVASGEERLVVAVGGDGTVRACAHHLAGTDVALAVVPRGAANLFAAALGLPNALEAALRTGFGSDERKVDLAVAGDEVFVAMAGIGVDAAIVRAASPWLKQHMGWLGYAVACVPQLARPAYRMTLQVDGGAELTCDAQGVVVGNVGLLPGHFVLMPGARLDDGLVDVGVVAPRNVLGWATLARRAMTARLSGRPAVEHFQAHHVEVTCETELERQVDGDSLVPGRALNVGVVHKALLVRAPRGRRRPE